MEQKLSRAMLRGQLCGGGALPEAVTTCPDVFRLNTPGRRDSFAFTGFLPIQAVDICLTDTHLLISL